MSSKESYRKFCKEHQELPLFLQDWYLDVVCADGEWDAAIIKDHEKIVGVLPYFLKNKGPFSIATMPLMTKHLGPYVIPTKRYLKYEHVLFEKLITQLPQTSYFIQDFLPSIQNWLPFHWENFNQTTRYTYVLNDLTDLDKVYASFNRNIRRNILKAEKKLRLVNDYDIETFYEINKMSFDRQGVPIFYPLDFLKNYDSTLAQKKARKIFFAVDENNEIHAASYLIWDKTRSYYHLAGENPDFRGSGASIFLTWEAIKYTRNQLGLKTFDFEGSMLKPIEAIRRQFGAKQEPYFRVWKYTSSLFQVLNWLKSRF